MFAERMILVDIYIPDPENYKKEIFILKFVTGYNSLFLQDFTLGLLFCKTSGENPTEIKRAWIRLFELHLDPYTSFRRMVVQDRFHTITRQRCRSMP